MEHSIAQPKEKCRHFTIRGFVASVREKDKNIGNPFSPEYRIELPPMRVPEFRHWTCHLNENVEERVEIQDPQDDASLHEEEYPPGVLELLLLSSQPAWTEKNAEEKLDAAGGNDETVLGTHKLDAAANKAENNTSVCNEDGSQPKLGTAGDDDETVLGTEKLDAAASEAENNTSVCNADGSQPKLGTAGGDDDDETVLGTEKRDTVNDAENSTSVCNADGSQPKLGSATEPINVADDEAQEEAQAMAYANDAEKNIPAHTAGSSQQVSNKKALKRKRANSHAARKGKSVAVVKKKQRKRSKMNSTKTVKLDASASRGRGGVANRGGASTSAVWLSPEDNWKIRKPRSNKRSPVKQNLPGTEKPVVDTLSDSGAHPETEKIMEDTPSDSGAPQEVTDLDTSQNNDVVALAVQQGENENQVARRGLDVDLNLIPMDEGDEEQFMEATFMDTAPPAADNHAEGELPATSANDQTISSSLDKGKSVVVERVILPGEASRCSQEETANAESVHCGTPPVSIEPANDEPDRRAIYSDAGNSMAGGQVFERGNEIVKETLPLQLPQTPDILWNRFCQRGNGAFEHARLSALSQYQGEPSTAARSTVDIPSRCGNNHTQQTAASGAPFLVGSQLLTGGLADLERRVPRPVPTRPNYLFLGNNRPHFDIRNWGFDRNKGIQPQYPYCGIDTGVWSNSSAARPVDLYYPNPATPFLGLMDAGMRHRTPVDLNTSHKPSDQSSMRSNHCELGVSRLGHLRNNEPPFPPSIFNNFGRNHHPGSFNVKSPVPAPAPAPVLLDIIRSSTAPVREVYRRRTPVQNRDITEPWLKEDFPGRLSTDILRDPAKGKSKLEVAPVQSLRPSSNISLSENGNPRTNRELASTVHLPQGPLSTLAIKDSTNRLETVGEQAETVYPGKRSHPDELCVVSRNPAEFTLPEERNKYMIGSSTGSRVKSVRRKQQKKAKITPQKEM